MHKMSSRDLHGVCWMNPDFTQYIAETRFITRGVSEVFIRYMTDDTYIREYKKWRRSCDIRRDRSGEDGSDMCSGKEPT